MKLLFGAISAHVFQITGTLNLDNTSFFNGNISLSTAGIYNLRVQTATPIYFKIWGAGGGSSSASNSGGRGGYTEGFIWLEPDTLYQVVVGGPGQTGGSTLGVAGGSPGGGGLCGRSNHGTSWSGSGGGYSGLFVGEETHENSLLIAGGGGGGGSGPANAAGGNGGGFTGGTGPQIDNGGPGGGGTQSEGGARGDGLGIYIGYDSGSTAGSALTGGKGATTLTTNYSAAGGGGGYYGGGGGGGNNYAGGNGGGGSGYIHPTLVSYGQTQQIANVGGIVPNSLDPDYKSPAGRQAADKTVNAFAGSGLVVLKDGYLIYNITASDNLYLDSTQLFTARTLSPQIGWYSPNLYGDIYLDYESGYISIPGGIPSRTITITAENYIGQSSSKNFFVGYNTPAYYDESDYNLTMTPADEVSIVSNERPFADVFSAYFSASTGQHGSYGIIIEDDILALGTGNFCVELWAKISATINSGAGLISGSKVSSSSSSAIAPPDSGAAIARNIQWTGNDWHTTGMSGTVPITNWNHIAFTRNGSTLKTYLNGTQLATVTGTIRNLLSTTYAIGHRYSGGTTSFNNFQRVFRGWLTNIRIVKGYTVYSGNFARPTAPVLQSGAVSATCYPSTANVNTTFPSSACVFLTNFRN